MGKGSKKYQREREKQRDDKSINSVNKTGARG
jgi:hypothetical protein